MNRDIREFEPKVIGPFTLKQSKCVVVMCAYGLPLFLILYRIDLFLALTIVAITLLPPLLIGWVKIRNLSFEKFIIRWFYWRIGTPRIRRYKSLPYTKQLAIDTEKQLENEKIAAMTKREFKKYEKAKAVQERVIYSTNPEYKAYK